MKLVSFAALLVAASEAATLYHGMGGSPNHYNRVQGEYDRRMGLQNSRDLQLQNRNYGMIRDRAYNQSYNGALAGERQARAIQPLARDNYGTYQREDTITRDLRKMTAEPNFNNYSNMQRPTAPSRGNIRPTRADAPYRPTRAYQGQEVTSRQQYAPYQARKTNPYNANAFK